MWIVPHWKVQGGRTCGPHGMPDTKQQLSELGLVRRRCDPSGVMDQVALLDLDREFLHKWYLCTAKSPVQPPPASPLLLPTQHPIEFGHDVHRDVERGTDAAQLPVEAL